ncbi:MAG: 16S rRNA (adenine(1518)-N(6)/adenine(1519)-N(6))-dimethyltransferase RsmA [Bacteroidia bacterium]|nr:16S rRNA (adenine(1518)-N(6)/adenine(1519)-N(6))-dimethyltransferase RsmA [Bacteroidia bacterium]
MVRPKKYLGQHFLKDQNIASKIVEALDAPNHSRVVEIGPGTGVLTHLLIAKEKIDLWVVEVDRESVDYLKKNLPEVRDKIIEGDFLRLDLANLFQSHVSIIGNFPYNISTQIFFRVLEYRHCVTQVVCMLQKEVAERIASPHGSKVYGILSVLLQAYYDIELLFKVPPGVFFPPPKVMSAVIRLKRNERKQLSCDESLFVKVVKQGFQTRRKTLRNALKPLNLHAKVSALPIFDKRAEQLSVEDFISLTLLIEQSGEAGSRI